MLDKTLRRHVTAAGLAACAILLATGVVAQDRDGDRDGDTARPRLNIFISPSGEPFHAPPGSSPVDVWFARVDANHDGVITLEEFKADAEAFFHRLDANGDGIVDGFEVSDYEQKIAPEILPRIARLTARDIPPLPDTTAGAHDRKSVERENEKPPSNREGEPMGAAMFMLMNEPEPVAAADTDFDGKVTLAETLAAARRRFEALDKAQDGRLTRAELPKTPAERQAEKAARKRHDKPS